MISPGLYFNELDFSQYAQALGSTVVLLIGGASRGPVDRPTQVTTEGSLVQKFGQPLLTDYGLQAGVRYLRKGNRLLYMRVANGEVTANRTLQGTTGGTAAVKATGTITFNASAQPIDTDLFIIGDGVVSKTFEFDNNATYTPGRIPVLIGATSAATMANLIAAINNSPLTITSVDTTVTVPQTTLTNDVGGTAGNVAITKTWGTAGNATVTGMAGGAAAIAGTTSAVLTVYANTPGSWGNEVSVTVVAPSTDPDAPSVNFDLKVFAPTDPNSDGSLQEQFRNLSLDPTSDRFIESVLVNGIADEIAASQYITADALTTGTPDAGSFTLGTGGGTAGTDGISGLVAADYVGTVSGQSATGLKAALNAETTEYNVLAIPGVTHATVLTALITHVEARRDCWAVIDVPFGLSYQEAADWVDGEQPVGVPNSPATALNTSFASAYAPWAQVYDPYNKRKIWLPPSAFVPGLAADTDRMSGAWFPIAGLTRGMITDALQLEYSPDLTAREVMVGTGFVNPLVQFPEGIVVYGNKTLQRRASSTQSVHVRWMLIHAFKLIATSARYVVWEPNDPTTWSKLERICSEPLRQIAASRGLDEFRVVCNESTNPPEVRSRKEIRGKVVLKPRDVAEAVVIDFALTSTGAVFDDAALSGIGGVGV